MLPTSRASAGENRAREAKDARVRDGLAGRQQTAGGSAIGGSAPPAGGGLTSTARQPLKRERPTTTLERVEAARDERERLREEARYRRERLALYRVRLYGGERPARASSASCSGPPTAPPPAFAGPRKKPRPLVPPTERHHAPLLRRCCVVKPNSGLDPPMLQAAGRPGARGALFTEHCGGRFAAPRSDARRPSPDLSRGEMATGAAAPAGLGIAASLRRLATETTEVSSRAQKETILSTGISGKFPRPCLSALR